MEQHPIPQQIASYQFKLVGDMTLKQFVQLAGGALISLLLYASPLHPLIKWPLIIISFLFGVALAFLPIEDRPLSTWIFIFFRSIYSPTYFVWNKSKKPIDYFTPEETPSKPASIKIADKKEKVQELLNPVIKKTEVTNKLEEKEKTFLTKLSQSFIAPNTTVVISTTPVHTYVSGMKPPAQPATTIPAPIQSTQPQPQAQANKRPQVIVPQTQQKSVGQLQGYQQATNPNQAGGQIAGTTKVIPLTYQKQDVEKFASSKFSQNVIPPLPATRENVVVGQVVDQYGQVVEGAILEIKDADGRPVRALRSNKLGHFMIATPLTSGEYVIQTEKDGYEFEPYKLKAENKIIEPIAIWAKTGGVKPEKVTEEQNEKQKFIQDYKF